MIIKDKRFTTKKGDIIIIKKNKDDSNKTQTNGDKSNGKSSKRRSNR